MLLFKADLVADSPFMIGNGVAEMSDNDVLVDRKGNPYVPGTTLAGVCRHYLQKIGMNNVEDVFGRGSNESQQIGNESKIIFYDAFQKTASCKNIRDSVKLNYSKEEVSSNPDNKFEYEVVNKGAEFEWRIELHLENNPEQEKSLIQCIINGIQSSEIRIGAKTTRGFGKFKLENLEYKQIDLDNDFEEYLDIDNIKWENWSEIGSSNKLFETYEYCLQLKGFIAIRNYASDVKHEDKDKDEKYIDAEALKNGNGEVIIPGTSWAGVFRQHCHRILDKIEYADKDNLLNSLFGYVDENNSAVKHKSQIQFEESWFEKDSVTLLKRTRTAIDRFTGGASHGSLFTQEIACQNDSGTSPTKLVIRIPIKLQLIDNTTVKEMDDSQTKLVCSLIQACIRDLSEGHLVVGGQGSIGAGMFTDIKGGDDGE